VQLHSAFEGAYGIVSQADRTVPGTVWFVGSTALHPYIKDVALSFSIIRYAKRNPLSSKSGISHIPYELSTLMKAPMVFFMGRAL
jgi:hypothetical protein